MTKEEYLLICLAEECAEIQQEVAKALRFGLGDSNPLDEVQVTNKEKIELEIVDLMAVVSRLVNSESLEDFGERHQEHFEAKEKKLTKWIKYSEDKGIIVD